jgi:hypothetical protein
MTTTIAALQWKLNEMELRSQVNGMKQYLGQLSSQVAELENALSRSSDVSGQVAHAPKAPTKRMDLRTALSSKATPFQSLSSKAQSFVPGRPSFQLSYESDTTCWPSDDSASSGSGGFSSD